MTFGIPRVHGALIAPKNFEGVAFQDFTLTFWNNDNAAVWADWNTQSGMLPMGTPNGALDQIFRSALGQIATVARVGTLSNTATTSTLNFAIEALGVDSFSSGYLGEGPTDGTVTPTSTAQALQLAVNSLTNVIFTITGVTYTVHLSSATVTTFTY